MKYLERQMSTGRVFNYISEDFETLCVETTALLGKRKAAPYFAECSGSYTTLQITELDIWEVPKIIILALYYSLRTPQILSSISKSHHSFV
jgi:hypothetical protein